MWSPKENKEKCTRVGMDLSVEIYACYILKGRPYEFPEHVTEDALAMRRAKTNSFIIQ